MSKITDILILLTQIECNCLIVKTIVWYDNEGMIILKSLKTKFSLWPVKLDLLDRSQKSPVSAFLA